MITWPLFGWLLIGAASPVLWRAGRTGSLPRAAVGLWLAAFGALPAWTPLAAGLLSIAAVAATATAVAEVRQRTTAKAAARRAIADRW